MKSGFIGVIGRANAGKSTLVNALVGEKVSIVSPRPQTTRNAIMGILTEADRQIVFIDTPGIYKAGTLLSATMEKIAETTARDVDALLFVTDGHDGIKDRDIELAKRFASLGLPMAIAFTKIDIMPKENIPENVKKLFEGGLDCDVFPVSARKRMNLQNLLDGLTKMLPEGEKVIDADIISDKSDSFMVAEIMREKILLGFDKEIPHGVAVVINSFKRNERGVYEINLDIICDKANHKAILIGKQGSAIKQVSTLARRDMEKFLQGKVYLTTYVKVREDWRDKPALIRDFGYGEDGNG